MTNLQYIKYLENLERQRRGVAMMQPGHHESEQFQDFRFQDHRAGMNTKVAPNLLPDNQLVLMKNCHSDVSGQIIKKKGYALYSSPGSTGNQVTGLYDFVYWSSGRQRKWLCTVGTAMKRWDEAAWQSITLPAVLTAGKLCSFASLSQKVLVGNGNQQVFYYDGTNNPTAITGLYGFHLTTYQNRIFCARDEVGGTYNSSTVRWCKLEDPTDWTAVSNAGFKDLDPGDGDRITGMIALGTNLIVFKKRSIWRMSGVNPNTATWDIITREIGCVSHNTIQRIGNDVFVMSERGIHRLSAVQEFGDFQMLDIEFPIEDLFEGLDRDNADQFHSAKIPELSQYWLLGRTEGASQNKRVLVFDYANNAWSYFDLTDGISVLASKSASVDEIPRIWGGGYDGQHFLMNHGKQDNGVSFQAHVQSKIYDLGISERTKRFRYIFLDFDPDGAAGGGTLKFWADGDSGNKTSYAISANSIRDRVHVGKAGNELELEILSPVDANDWILKGWTISASVKSKRGYRRTSGITPPQISAGSIIIFIDRIVCPTGYTRVSALDSKFPRGNTIAGGTGGSANTGSTAPGAISAGPGSAAAAPSAHTHTYTPPYVDVLVCKKD